MLSRVANSIYWFARYVERAENIARLISVNANLLLDLPIKLRLGWEPLIEITGSKDLFYDLYDEPAERNVVRFLIADTRNSSSIVGSISQARENARTIRDILPREAWENINKLHLEFKDRLPGGLAQKRRFELLRFIIDSTQQLTGLLAGTMIHDSGYNFLRMGRNLERGDMTTRIVDVRSASLLPEEIEEYQVYENIEWMSVLQSLSAQQSFQQQIQGPIRRQPVLKFLLQSRLFPRAFLHCLGEVKSCLQKLPRNREPLALVRQLTTQVKSTKTKDLDPRQMNRLLDDLQIELAKVDLAIQEIYFS
jgi:uncharacterized alpha-E superfamily protein